MILRLLSSVCILENRTSHQSQLRFDWFGPWFWLILSRSMVDSSLFSTLIDWFDCPDCRTDPLIEFFDCEEGPIWRIFTQKLIETLFATSVWKANCRLRALFFWRNLLTHSISHHRIDNWRVWLILKVCHALWNSQLTQINQEDWNGSGWDAPN